MNKVIIAILGCSMLAACGTQPVTPSVGHIKDEPRPVGNIPKTVQQATPLPPPKPALKAETYSVVVNNVPVQELLFALARELFRSQYKEYFALGLMREGAGPLLTKAMWRRCGSEKAVSFIAVEGQEAGSDLLLPAR